MKCTIVRLCAALLLAAAATLAGATVARAQGYLSFSGGNGTPLVITLNNPVLYVSTGSVEEGRGPVFIFDEVGDVFNNGVLDLTGSVTYSINSGAPYSINLGSTGSGLNDITVNDLVITFTLSPGVAAGSTILLSAGTLTTTTDVAAAPPADGSYRTFVTGADGVATSPDGVAVVPEPRTWALIGAGMLTLVGIQRRRRSKVTA